MARASVRTLLSLDRFAQIVGIHPLHFNGVFHDLAPANTCGQPLMQHAWQIVDGVAREDIAVAIAEAEERISSYLQFRPLPTFEIDERRSRAVSTVRLDYGYAIAAGVEARTAISLNAPVVFSDDDGDGYNETATITATTTVTDPNEVVICIPGEGGGAEWEIRPIRVSIASGTATILARREQLVLPSLQEALAAQSRGVDGATDANFLPNVDVYQVALSPIQQVQMLWTNTPNSCGCLAGACSTCYLTGQFGCASILDNRISLVSIAPASWNTTDSVFEATQWAVARAPDRARFWYRAGWRKPGAVRWAHDMDPKWERIIAYYAVTFLHRSICGCRNMENITTHWGTDLARSSSNSSTAESFRLSPKVMDNPLGTTRGALHAWNAIRTQALGEAANV